MLNAKIGCCGFPTSKKKYFALFPAVEINTTFYAIPDLKLIKKWRKEAPAEFEFTVKAHQSITHVHRLKLSSECLSSLEKMAELCEGLHAKLLLLQTPPSFRPTPEALETAAAFFGRASREFSQLRLVWETRGPGWENPKAQRAVAKLVEGKGVIHAGDLLASQPAKLSDLVYTRLHGLGRRMYYYQYKDSELRQLYHRLEEIANGRQLYVFFNNLSMLQDAARFQQLNRRGKLPPLSEGRGAKALEALLSRARFPASKSQIVNRCGWRVVEVAPGKQKTVEELLAGVAAQKFDSLQALLSSVEEVLRGD